MNIKIILVTLVILIICSFSIFNLKDGGNNIVLAKDSNSKALVVYFSRTGQQYSVGNISEGNTAIIGKIIAKETNADIFEIKVVKDEYPTNDYTALTQVAKVEKQQNARPAIIGKVEDFSKYDVIFIGFPNWYRSYPRIVAKFIRDNKWIGKTVIPFCTNEEGALGIGELELRASVKGAVIKQGFAERGYNAETCDDKVKAWLKDVL